MQRMLLQLGGGSPGTMVWLNVQHWSLSRVRLLCLLCSGLLVTGGEWPGRYVLGSWSQHCHPHSMHEECFWSPVAFPGTLRQTQIQRWCRRMPMSAWFLPLFPKLAFLVLPSGHEQGSEAVMGNLVPVWLGHSTQIVGQTLFWMSQEYPVEVFIDEINIWISRL